MARMIRASEVGEYLFCARAWWLRHVEGLEPAGQERRLAGEYAHRRHSGTLQSSRLLLWLGAALLLAALLVALLS